MFGHRQTWLWAEQPFLIRLPCAPGPVRPTAARLRTGAANSPARARGQAAATKYAHIMLGEQQDWPAPAAAGPVRARLALPGSKSITNRALILAALADSPTRIVAPLRARDTELMTAAVAALGAEVSNLAGADGATGDWLVTPGWRDAPAVVDVGNAGTVLRFVPPAAALARAEVAFRGDARAAQRPVGPLLDALAQLGAQISDDGRRAVPFTVRGQGRLPGGSVTLNASGSSQLVSGLLLAAARYDKGAEIRHEGPPIPSAPHLAMTVAMLRAAGAEVETAGSGTTPARDHPVTDIWRVQPGALSPGRIEVEPDLSNSGPFLAAALATGGEVTIAGWPARSLQASDQILDALTRMGATCTPEAGGMRVTGPGTVTGVTADLRDISELTPVLVALAATADSPSKFTGIGHLRTHECDRLAVLAQEIGALGGGITELADGLRVRPRPLRAGAAAFDPHDDHRLVMAAAVLGLSVPGLRVANAATVAKTLPGFFGLWEQLLGPGTPPGTAPGAAPGAPPAAAPGALPETPR
jgi:3-phosphoshikimate 1-carboxyvinyltransferase